MKNLNYDSNDENKKSGKGKICVLLGVIFALMLVYVCYLTGTFGDSDKKKTEDENYTVIYYKGYEQPSIYYEVENGEKCEYPGVAMEETQDFASEGYLHVYTIPLGSADKVNVAFCNETEKDDNSGKYYEFSKGYFKFADGKIENMTSEEINSITGLRFVYFKADSEEKVEEGKDIKLNAKATGGKEPYNYKFYYYNSKSEETIVQEYSENSEITISGDHLEKGLYTLGVSVKDNDGIVIKREMVDYVVAGLSIKSIKPSVPSSQVVGSMITFSLELDENNITDASGLTYKYVVSKNGQNEQELSSSADGQATWVPTENGTYNIKAEISDKEGHKGEAQIQYTIEGDNNADEVILYYRGYSNPYVSYQLGDGGWTNEPGIAMTPSEEMDGYTHVAKIKMVNCSFIRLAINDGNGQWDNNNGQYYMCNAGTYTLNDGFLARIDTTTIDGNQGGFGNFSSGDTIVIYYKGIDKPYIHYAINNVWTESPGIKMEKAKAGKIMGFKYKIEITCEEADYILACFNDGEDEWDNNNGEYYKFERGMTYYVRDGKMSTNVFD